MRRVLIVANQTLGGTELQQEIRRLADAGPCEFFVLVPATNPIHLELAPEGFGGYRALGALLDEHGPELAQRRLETELARLKESGVTATGSVGDPDPLHAVRDELAVREYDEIVVATLPVGVSRWLRQDLVHRLQRRFDLPVTHVVSHERFGSVLH